MPVVSVINFKGGVGKTTLAANLGAELARRGSKILLIDLDPQTSLTFCFYDPDIFLKGVHRQMTIKRWFDNFSGGMPSASLAELVVTPAGANAHVRTGGGRLDLIASHLGLINVDLELAAELGGTTPRQSKARFLRVHGSLAEGLNEDPFATYDLVLIDCPPNFNIVTKSAIVASTHLLVPARPDYLSTLGIEYLYQNVTELVRQYNDYVSLDSKGVRPQGISPVWSGVAFTMVRPHAQRPVAAQRNYIERTRELGLPVFSTTIRDSPTLFADAGLRGVPPVLRPGAASEPAIGELKRLATEFFHHVYPGRAAA